MRYLHSLASAARSIASPGLHPEPTRGRGSRHLAICASLWIAGFLPIGSAQGQVSLLPKPPATQVTTATTPAPPSAPADLAIPLPQIADQAEALDLQLADISRGLNSQQDKTTLDPVTSSRADEISQRALQVDSFLEGGPDILQLREEIVYWRALSRLSSEQRKVLTDRADQLQSQIGLLTEELARWQATRDAIHDETGIEVVAARVQHELDAIRAIRSQAQAQLNQVLTLQNDLSQTGRKVSDSLAKLNEAEARFRVSLFDQDGHPLWSRNAFYEADQPMALMMRRSTDQEITTAKEFVRSHAVGLLSIPILYFLCLLAALGVKRYLASPAAPAIDPEARRIFDRPFTIALLACLLLTIPEFQSAPLSIAAAIYLCWLLLSFVFTPILVEIRMRSLVYLLLGLNLFELVRSAVPLPAGPRRTLLPLLVLVVLIAFGWLARPSRLRSLGLSKWPLISLQLGIWIGMLLLAIAMVANVFGFIALSRVLGVGTLLSAFFAVALYFVVRILLLALSVLLESPWCRYLSGEIRAALLLWSRRVLYVCAVVVWWTRSEIYVFMLQESFASGLARAFSYPIPLGEAHFTIANVISVLLILGFGFSLAKGISSLLRTVLVARFPMQRGMPYAVSKVSYYLLGVLVLLAALTAAGVDLNRFTVITGAVGVGVGFGLQNIVNNFASGLILLFERPIRIDDTVEVNGLVGTVKRIGARSSTIATFQGAEVIVPNSNLVQNHVINWTLSSPFRRVEIPVGVAYGTEPETVMNLLVSEATAHESVMTEPAPVAFFTGFGDSALNFELRFWSSRQDIWFQVKSDVTLAISRALNEAGIEIPFPQRDLHLRSIDASISNQAGLLAPSAPAASRHPASPSDMSPATSPSTAAQNASQSGRLANDA